jgi:hypothetical protein
MPDGFGRYCARKLRTICGNRQGYPEEIIDMVTFCSLMKIEDGQPGAGENSCSSEKEGPFEIYSPDPDPQEEEGPEPTGCPTGIAGLVIFPETDDAKNDEDGVAEEPLVDDHLP